MATKTKKPKAPASNQLVPSETKMIRICDIIANTAQSRGMGVLSSLQALGWGLFEKISMDSEKEPIWFSLISTSADARTEACQLLEAHEPELVNLARSQEGVGQLQPIGVLAESVKDSEDPAYDVIFGMRRVLARAYLHAKTGDKQYAEIEAKIFTGKLSETDLIYLALDENDSREGESPIDKAITFARLKKLGEKQGDIAARKRVSPQTVSVYLSLLDKKLEDKRLAIHTGSMSVDQAIKLLAKRKTHGEDAEPSRESSNGDTRHRLPAAKKLVAIYEGHRPEDLSDEEWDLFCTDPVRKLLCFWLGLKFSPYKPPKVKEEKKSRKKDDEAPAPDPTGKIEVDREDAVKLLIALGKTNARTWEDKKIKEQLENIVSIVEPDQKVEDEKLQILLDALLNGYCMDATITMTR